MFVIFGMLIWACVSIALAIVLGLLGVLIALPLAGKHKRKRKLTLAFLSPGLAIAILIGCSIVTMIVTSVICDVDLGIGDAWSAPLPNGYKITSIDMPGNGSIQKWEDHSLTNVNVNQLQVIGDTIIGKYDKNDYFLLDTRTDSISHYYNIESLQTRLNGPKIELIENSDFYWQTKRVPYSIGFTIALCCIAIALYLLWRIGLSDRWDKLHDNMSGKQRE